MNPSGLRNHGNPSINKDALRAFNKWTPDAVWSRGERLWRLRQPHKAKRPLPKSSSAPKNTLREIIEKLNKEINAGLADSKIKAQLSD